MAPVVSLGIGKGGDAEGNTNVGLHKELREQNLLRTKLVIPLAPRLSVGKGGDTLGNATVTPMVERKQDPLKGLWVKLDKLSRVTPVLPHKTSNDPRRTGQSNRPTCRNRGNNQRNNKSGTAKTGGPSTSEGAANLESGGSTQNRGTTGDANTPQASEEPTCDILDALPTRHHPSTVRPTLPNQNLSTALSPVADTCL